MLAYANLKYGGRTDMFCPETRQQMLDKLVELKPDVVMITGDLTYTSLPSEFAAAKLALRPILDNFPTFIIPGNHDKYTRSHITEMRKHFGPWMGVTMVDSIHNSLLPVFSYKDLYILGIDSAVPNILWSRGHYHKNLLKKLGVTLTPEHEQYPPRVYPPLTERVRYLRAPQDCLNFLNKYVILATHYPVLDRNGKDYSKVHPYHGADNNFRLMQILDSAQVKPHMICHGHDHQAFSQILEVEPPASDPNPAKIPIEIHNPGSLSLKYSMPKSRSDWHRIAGMNIYHLSRDDVGVWTTDVERWIHNGREVIREEVPYSSFRKFGEEDPFAVKTSASVAASSDSGSSGSSSVNPQGSVSASTSATPQAESTLNAESKQ